MKKSQQKKYKTALELTGEDLKKIYQEAYAMALKKLEEEKQQRAKK